MKLHTALKVKNRKLGRRVKLHTALKVKNRLAGELNRLQAIFQRENARRSDNVSKVERDKIFDQMNSVRNELVRVKSAIAKANIGIYPVLAQMEEAKSFIAYLTNLPCREGDEIEMVGYGATAVQKEYSWDSFLNQEAKDNLIRNLQVQVEQLQDAADAYNASTEVEL